MVVGIVGHRSACEKNPWILMLTFNNLAERISENTMTYISSFESTQFFDYAMKHPNLPFA